MTSESIPLGQLIRDETRISYGIVQPGQHIEEGTVFVQAKDIAANNQDTAQLSRVEPKIALGFPRTKLSGGELLVSIVGVVGASMVAPLEFAGANVSRSVAVIKTGDKETSEWIHYVIQSHEAQCFIDAYCDRAVQPRINLQTLAKLPIYFPHKAKRIDISNHLRTIDDFLKISSQITQKSNQMISALFRSWFIDFNPVKAKAEGKLPYGMDEETAAFFPDSFEDSELGPIPSGWEISKLTNIAKVTMGTSPKGETYCNLDEGVMPLLNGAADFDGQKLTPNQDTIAPTTIAKALDFVFCIRATIGNLTIADRDYCIGRCVASAREINSFDRTFLYCNIGHLLRTWKWNAIGSVIVGVSGPEVKNSSIVLPPQPIRMAFEKAVKEQMILIDFLHDSQASLSTLRDVLLPRLMSGELTIPEVI